MTACAAFTAATTTGIPASANVPVGTTTMQWLATQETGATPALLAQLGKFTAATTNLNGSMTLEGGLGSLILHDMVTILCR